MAKSLAINNFQNYCKLICFVNITNFRGPLEISKCKFFCQQNKFYLNFGEIRLVSIFGHCTFELGLQFDLMAAKKNPTDYCKLTLHTIITKLLGSLHNTQEIIFFQPNNFYSIIVDAQNKFASKNGHFCGYP